MIFIFRLCALLHKYSESQDGGHNDVITNRKCVTVLCKKNANEIHRNSAIVPVKYHRNFKRRIMIYRA